MSPQQCKCGHFQLDHIYDEGACRPLNVVCGCMKFQGHPSKIEVVEDGILFTSRMKVDGGWIYRSYDKSAGILAIVFVPNPPPNEAWTERDGV